MPPRRDVPGVKPSTALRTGWRALAERSASVLPLYLLASGLYGIARVPLLVAGLVALWIAGASGRLDPFVEVLRRSQREASGDAAGSDPFASGTVNPDQLGPGFGDAVGNLLTPEIVALLALGALGAVVLGIVASAVGSAVAVGGIAGLLRGDDGVRAGVDGAAAYWRSILGVRVLLLLALAVVVVPLGSVVAGVASAVLGAAASASGAGAAPSVGGSVAAAGIAVLGALVGAVLVLVVVLLFAFAEQAVVVDDAGALAAVRRSVRFPLDRPTAFLGYVAVAFGALVVSVTVAVAGSLTGTARLTGLVGAIALPPIVDGYKTSVYAETALPDDPNPTPLDERARAAFLGGLREVGAFVRDHPVANLAALACILAGGAIGWVATSSFGVTLPVGSDVGDVFAGGPLGPVGTAVNLAVNNWLVAADLAYSGLAAGVPAVVSLGFNGLLVGAVGGVFDPTAFAALVAPHGVVEVPALVVGGGLGLHLGAVVLGAFRGRRGADDVVDAVRLAYRVLLGLAPLFVVAGLIEAFLTPAIAALVLGG
ncbi:stage II sporulation protein M [Halobellus rubicundus]|uniref:Stage II sporulation protein M n=1 Tax=Halobellus rubicundus TaxID=2996466 RepID=A0ABD5MCH0_9EURY